MGKVRAWCTSFDKDSISSAESRIHVTGLSPEHSWTLITKGWCRKPPSLTIPSILQQCPRIWVQQQTDQGRLDPKASESVEESVRMQQEI